MAISYTLANVPAVVRDRTTLKWSLVDVSNLTSDVIFSQYLECEIGVLDAYGHVQTVNLYKYEATLRYQAIKLDSWLLSIKGTALFILHSGAPTLVEASTNYVPLWSTADATAELCKRNWNPTNTPSLEDADDIIINIANLTPQYLKDYGLWLINGWVVPATYHTYGLRMWNAGDIVRRSSEMSIGFLNFESIGKLSYQPLKVDSIFKQDGFTKYGDGVVIKCDQELNGKTVGLVLGGYLHLLDGTIKQVGHKTISFTPNKMDLLHRLVQSNAHLELGFTGIDTLSESQLVSKITSDQFWIDYLTSQYSMLVYIDTDKLYRTVDYPDHVTRPGNFLIDKDTPLGYMVDQYGKGVCYWPKYESGQWALLTEDKWHTTLAAKTTQWQNATRINDGQIGDYRKIPNKVKLFTYTRRK